MSEPSPFSPGTRILAAGALLLGLFLGVGFLLPGRWTAEASTTLDASREQILPFVDGPAGWKRWTAWPDSALQSRGPERGAGAAVEWNELDVGQGAFEIVRIAGDSAVDYRVDVEHGALRTDGSVRLSSDGSGTRVRWSERGDFGWNPLMGYWALVMDGVQTRQMEQGLERLRRVVVEGPGVDGPDPAAPHEAGSPAPSGTSR